MESPQGGVQVSLLLDPASPCGSDGHAVGQAMRWASRHPSPSFRTEMDQAAKSRWILNPPCSVPACQGAPRRPVELAFQAFPGAPCCSPGTGHSAQGYTLPSRWAGWTLRFDAAQSQEISLTQRAKPAKGSERGRKHQAREEMGRYQLHEHQRMELVQRKS